MLLVGGSYLTGLIFRIHAQSRLDERRPADVILVLGAAEYAGRPSPVLKARLDHAHELYRRGYAPLLMTTGGAGGDPVHTEGGVGRAYLSKLGVPAENVLVESKGESTVASVAAAADLMRRGNLKSALVVSDGYHIFRVKRLLEAQGIRAYGSPRKDRPRSSWTEWWLCARQAVSYSLWRVGIPV